MKKLHVLIPSLVATISMPLLSMVGCSKPIETYVVTLFAGEGTFGESNQIILSNIQPGTLLKDVEGYKTPLGESFAGWLNNGKEFKENQPINSNMLLTAKYEEPEPEHDYSKDCLTFTALEESEFAITNQTDDVELLRLPDLQYSTDEGKTWIQYTIKLNDTGQFIHLNKNEHIIFKGHNPAGFSQYDILSGYRCVTRFMFNQGSVDVSGNVMSLLDNGLCSFLQMGYTGCFSWLFSAANGDDRIPYLHDTMNLILPSTNLTYLCYLNMFWQQFGLHSLPKLPAKELEWMCYSHMFNLDELPYTYLVVSDSGDEDKMFMDLTAYKSDSDLPPASVASMFGDVYEIHAGHKYYWSLKN